MTRGLSFHKTKVQDYEPTVYMSYADDLRMLTFAVAQVDVEAGYNIDVRGRYEGPARDQVMFWNLFIRLQ
eukprot:CAMPEP_0198353146 /NCGR_PEP_ID=MMETSP1450-20131203/110217_1 /TAXON_ID=753684 ORGANISM="Madagascaria erythrocladiodes, Strain CCMP3234" /NCGR_SAMPLE_ID=MMETSP1450 /ASSEMBLY_ACC=CAM_ASM_001115 /LENGTH=69 /DNA_ID=CAMNT_0044059263 /DNA_START=72 /DNA_END=278 /DNA_ORIENTATION=+